MTPAKKKSLLDSWALIAYLSGERSGAAVRDLLRAADAAGERLLMNEVNIGEVYYLVAKRRSPAAATAIRHGAILVTGDREFRALEGQVTVRWI
jgi:predicted nucleic acid-binding protein